MAKKTTPAKPAAVKTEIPTGARPGANPIEILAGLESDLAAATLGGFQDKIKAISEKIAAHKAAYKR